MLEIVLLYFLTRNNGRLAEQKGEPKSRWQLYTVLAWFGLEIVGVAVGILFLGEDMLVLAALLGLLGGFGGYLLVRHNLEQRPDAPATQEDLIEQIGEDRDPDAQS